MCFSMWQNCVDLVILYACTCCSLTEAEKTLWRKTCYCCTVKYTHPGIDKLPQRGSQGQIKRIDFLITEMELWMEEESLALTILSTVDSVFQQVQCSSMDYQHPLFSVRTSTSSNNELGIWTSVRFGLVQDEWVLWYVKEHDKCTRGMVDDGCEGSLHLAIGHRLWSGICKVQADPYDDDNEWIF